MALILKQDAQYTDKFGQIREDLYVRINAIAHLDKLVCRASFSVFKSQSSAATYKAIDGFDVIITGADFDTFLGGVVKGVPLDNLYKQIYTYVASVKPINGVIDFNDLVGDE